jgi:hypothetical protein
MRIFLPPLLAVLFALVLSPAWIFSPAQAANYLAAASDLPLPDGLTEAEEKSTVFDSPVGRLVTAYAKGALSADQVHDFYDATLPQLGWEKSTAGNWRRQHETLKIDVFGPDEGPVTVTFTLSAENE